MNSQDLYSFLSDERLVDLVERVKISDDFLDVVSLTETQHSDMLSWCLHPNEGHAQGDAVVKDFLVAAYNAAAETCTHSNKVFFKKWTPGRIRTASFGAAFIAREFSLSIAEENTRRRLDLFLIDPGNKIVVTIENKVGAALTAAQLSAYYSAVEAQIGGRPVFKDYDFAYVVVDRDLEEYGEEHLGKLGNRWALLDYSWLKSSANRARRHMERNNEAAQLLMAYCQKQTGWQSPNEKQISELAAELASQHEAVVDEIQRIRKVKPTQWTPTSFNGEAGELLLFIQQNRQLCDHLVQSKGIGSVLVGLRKALPRLSHDDMEHGRTWVRFATESMQSLMQSTDGYWPLYVNIFRESKSDDESSKFTVRVIWANGYFHEDECNIEAFRKHMAGTFPGLAKFSGSAVRRLVVANNLAANSVLKKTVEVVTGIEAQITAARQAGILA